jgi:hypothetical protein
MIFTSPRCQEYTVVLPPPRSKLPYAHMITAGKLEASFSNITYQQVAPYVWLNPSAAGRDMQPLDVFRARIPKDMLREITRDVDDALTQYGPLDSHDNEETRSRFISSVSGNKYFSRYSHFRW